MPTHIDSFRLIIVLFLYFAVVGLSIEAQSELGEPSIIDSITVLAVDDQYSGFDNPAVIFDKATQFEEIEMSRNGDYIVARTRVTQASGELVFSNLYVWDTSTFEAEQQIVFPAPNTVLALDQTNYRADFAISPIDSHIALLTTSSLKILALPSLELIDEIAVNGIDKQVESLAWSLDGSIVAGLTDEATSVVFWNIVTNEVTTVSLDIQSYPSYITPETSISMTEFRWVIQNFYQHPEIAFINCTMNGECRHNIIENSLLERAFDNFSRIDSITIVENQSPFILTRIFAIGSNSRGLSQRVIEWQNDEDISPNLLPETAYCPLSISPSGLYLYSSSCNTPSGIWNTNTMEIQRLLDFEPVWLPNENFIVTLSFDFVVSLELTNEKRTIDLLDISSFSEIDSDMLAFTDTTRIVGMSENGTQVLLNLGGIASIVYISYE